MCLPAGQILHDLPFEGHQLKNRLLWMCSLDVVYLKKFHAEYTVKTKAHVTLLRLLHPKSDPKRLETLWKNC